MRGGKGIMRGLRPSSALPGTARHPAAGRPADSAPNRSSRTSTAMGASMCAQQGACTTGMVPGPPVSYGTDGSEGFRAGAAPGAPERGPCSDRRLPSAVHSEHRSCPAADRHTNTGGVGCPGHDGYRDGAVPAAVSSSDMAVGTPTPRPLMPPVIRTERSSAKSAEATGVTVNTEKVCDTPHATAIRAAHGDQHTKVGFGRVIGPVGSPTGCTGPARTAGGSAAVSTHVTGADETCAPVGGGGGGGGCVYSWTAPSQDATAMWRWSGDMQMLVTLWQDGGRTQCHTAGQDGVRSFASPTFHTPT